MSVHQVPPPSRRSLGDSQSLAILVHEPEMVAQRYGLVYDEGRDDMGIYRVAAVALGEDLEAWIFKHTLDANPGTCIYVGADTDLARALDLVLAALALTREDLAWVAEP